MIIVCASRMSKDEFFEKSQLGKSLTQFCLSSEIKIQLYEKNTNGLSKVYNHAIQYYSDQDPQAFLFIHDDVYLSDYFWYERTLDGLNTFDAIGLAGNRNIYKNQYSWFWDDKNKQDSANNLSGRVGHGRGLAYTNISYYGKVPSTVKLIDGVFIAVNSSVFKNKNVRFDERFNFHFYDLDFCQTLIQQGYKIGTWPIAIVHESSGNLGTAEWYIAADNYRKKWFG